MLLIISPIQLLILVIYFQGVDSNDLKLVAFYNISWDLAHISFIRDCNNFFPRIQKQHGFIYESTSDWTKLEDTYLSNVDVVMFLDDSPKQSSQREAFKRFIERGGGFLGFHYSGWTNNSQEWPWYYDFFLASGDYVANTWRPTSAILQNEHPSHPVLSRLPPTFSTPPNEWYRWKNNITQNPRIEVLLSIHPDSFPLGNTVIDSGEIWYQGYYPVVWTNKMFNMLYLSMGHNDIAYDGNYEELSHTFDNEIQNRLVIDGIKWLGANKRKYAKEYTTHRNLSALPISFERWRRLISESVIR